MNPTNSPLHRALNLPHRPIQFTDVVEAAESGLPESGELDWKRRLPNRDNGAAEFAKDVTAFANSTGGVLIYGVGDNGHVHGLPDVDLTADINWLQQRLAAHVRPYLTGVYYQELTGEAMRLLLVFVPPSAAAPHLVYEQPAAADGKRASVVPLRVNNRTEWLDERQLAAAYRRRFELHDNRRQHLAELAGFAAEQMTPTAAQSGWLTFAATPIVPELRDPIIRHKLFDIAGEALRLSEAMRSTDKIGTVLTALSQNALLNPRVGLRSWVASNAVAEADSNSERPTYLEVHHDGSTTLTVDASWRVNNIAIEHSTVISSALIDDAAVQFVAVASLIADQQAPSSELLLCASIDASNRGRSFTAIDTSSDGHLERRWSRRIPRVRPVSTVLLPHPVRPSKGCARARVRHRQPIRCGHLPWVADNVAPHDHWKVWRSPR